MKIRLQHRDAAGEALATTDVSKVKTLAAFAFFGDTDTKAGMILSYHETDFYASRLKDLENGYASVEYHDGSGWEESQNSTYFFDSGWTSEKGVRTAVFLGLDQVLTESALDTTSLGATLDSRGRLVVTGDARTVIEDAVDSSVTAPISVTVDTNSWAADTYTPPLSLSSTQSVGSLLSAYEAFGLLTHYWQGFALHLAFKEEPGSGTGIPGSPFKVALKSSLTGPLPVKTARLQNTATLTGIRISYLDGGLTPASYLVSDSGLRPYESLASAEAPESVQDATDAEEFGEWFYIPGMTGVGSSVLLKVSFGMRGSLASFELGKSYEVAGETLPLSYRCVYLSAGVWEAKLVFGDHSPAVEAQLDLL